MALKQQMKQSLGMTMTPQLQQAIKILQMSVLELQQEVNNELVENPTLEEVHDEMNQRSSDTEKKDGPESKEADNQLTLDEKQAYSQLENSDWGQSKIRTTKNTPIDSGAQYEQILSKPSTLFDHLMWQFRMLSTSTEELLIAEEVVGNLNEDGYLQVDITDLATELKQDLSSIEAILYKIQRFDPSGVAARDLEECLLIQYEMLDEDDEVEVIIKNHLKELETKNYVAISKALELPLNRTISLCQVVHSMEPKPGRAFQTNDAQYFVPDIYVVKLADKFAVVLNEDGIPRLKVSDDYKQQLDSGKFTGDTKSYIRDKLKGAHWLLKSIYQRQRTIYRVTECILEKQKEFFEEGPSALKPMILKDVAIALELHESTISRVTTNKFVHTPHGIFELKYFFNSAIRRSDGEGDMASSSVKLQIKELITTENTKKPLSDQKIVDILKLSNINIARRTVAKYRESLGILPSSKRKKYF